MLIENARNESLMRDDGLPNPMSRLGQMQRIPGPGLGSLDLIPRRCPAVSGPNGPMGRSRQAAPLLAGRQPDPGKRSRRILGRTLFGQSHSLSSPPAAKYPDSANQLNFRLLSGSDELALSAQIRTQSVGQFPIIAAPNDRFLRRQESFKSGPGQERSLRVLKCLP